MNLDNVADRCRRNWAILFLSIILITFDSFLLISFIRHSWRFLFWSSRENLANRLCHKGRAALHDRVRI